MKFRELFSLTDRQTDNPIFHKVETYLDRFLVPEMYVTSNFVKIVRAVLEIYESCVHRQNDRQINNLIFYKFETFLDCLLIPKIYVIPNFVKIFKWFSRT